MRHNYEQQDTNLMAANAMLPTSSIKTANANEAAAITPELQRWVDFVELIAGEMVPVHQEDEVAPFIKDAEERRKMEAEKRLKAKLRKMEVEQKAELLRQVMEKRAREFGDEWPRIQEMSQDPRFDHIPKPCAGDKEIIAGAFPWASPIKSHESNE